MVQKNAVRQDFLRGIRWGAILLIVMLLTIAAYRVIGTSPAVASEQPVEQPSEPSSNLVEIAPVPEAEVDPTAAIQVGTAAIKAPDAPAPSPAPVRRRAAAPVPAAPPASFPPIERRISSRFVPAPVVAPKPKPDALASVILPEAIATAPEISMSGPGKVPALNPEADDNTKQGNRATRIVRSVGRIFRFGRKETKESK